MDKNHPLVKTVEEAVRATLKREVEIRWFAGSTDCGHFAEAGIPFVGFGPGEVKYAHTNRERISLQMMKEAMECYPGIISNVSRLEKRKR